MRKRVLLLGHGEMGHAMHALLAPRCEIAFWQRRDAAGDLDKRASDADIAIFCVPARAYAELAERIGPQLPPDAVCIGLAKGLDAEGRTAPQAFAATLASDRAYGFLYGPMIAEEMLRGRLGFANVSATSATALRAIETLFAPTALMTRRSTDMHGDAWCAILKNLYAVLCGCADGHGLGDNVRGLLSVAALDEMRRLVPLLGGRGDNIAGFAGLGDLITTATSTSSHHHALGVSRARGPVEPTSGEAVNTVAALTRYGLLNLAEFPLLALTARCLGAPPVSRDSFVAALTARARSL